ncbi:MAG: hypothetical protein ACRC51_00570 [Cetobacterium sp.]
MNISENMGQYLLESLFRDKNTLEKEAKIYGKLLEAKCNISEKFEKEIEDWKSKVCKLEETVDEGNNAIKLLTEENSELKSRYEELEAKYIIATEMNKVASKGDVNG